MKSVIPWPFVRYVIYWIKNGLGGGWGAGGWNITMHMGGCERYDSNLEPVGLRIWCALLKSPGAI